VNKKLRVLVVDDQEPTRQGVAALLELTADIEVINQASNGWEAVHIVAEEGPDVVLMDVRMPIMDGLEATRQIKERWPQVKVIIATMYPSHKEDALAAGADRVLLKGSMRANLEDVIREVASSDEPRTTSRVET
jgi:DNA-binding NarL/FixJ family response regulator